jgi:hypothetical protein
MVNHEECGPSKRDEGKERRPIMVNHEERGPSKRDEGEERRKHSGPLATT